MSYRTSTIALGLVVGTDIAAAAFALMSLSKLSCSARDAMWLVTEARWHQ